MPKERKPPFHIADAAALKAGEVTDVYFARTEEVLRKKGIHRQVAMEVTASSLPKGYDWGVLAGVEECAALLEGLPVDVDCMNEGTLFRAWEPVLCVSGDYLDFGRYETSLLGLLCQASGIATKAARCKLAAGGKTVISFGARRQHPALAPMIERAAYLGGCDGVATIAAADLIGEPAMGTMPHALMLVLGSDVAGFKAFDQEVNAQIGRVCLVDTFRDEVEGAMAAVDALGERLRAVRLDTPSSRRGDILEIARQVRWELDIKGRKDVQILVSGGLDEEEIARLSQVVDAFGVGTAISNALVINFALDIVEVEGKPFAKRGKYAGRKQVYACEGCGSRQTTLAETQPQPCECAGELKPLLHPLLRSGKLASRLPTAQEIREFVLGQLARL